MCIAILAYVITRIISVHTYDALFCALRLWLCPGVFSTGGLGELDGGDSPKFANGICVPGERIMGLVGQKPLLLSSAKVVFGGRSSWR